MAKRLSSEKKREKPNLRGTMVHANDSKPPCPQLCETRLGRLKLRRLSAVKVLGLAFLNFFLSEKQVLSPPCLKTEVL